MKTIIIFFVLLSSVALAQDIPATVRPLDTTRSMASAQDASIAKNTTANVVFLATPAPQNVKELPLQWRGATLFLDASNRFKDAFSKVDYGFGAGAAVGYKQYNFKFEAVAPLAGDAWRYRIKLEYQVF